MEKQIDVRLMLPEREAEELKARAQSAGEAVTTLVRRGIQLLIYNLGNDPLRNLLTQAWAILPECPGQGKRQVNARLPQDTITELDVLCDNIGLSNRGCLLRQAVHLALTDLELPNVFLDALE